MNEAPKGKIGRLPRAIQEQVNRRLENGEKARTLVAWLNALPEVQAVLAAEFAGQPVNEKNLSKWRKYGYKQWLWHQQALAMTQEMTSPLSHPVPDQMAGWVTARYLFPSANWWKTALAASRILKPCGPFCMTWSPCAGVITPRPVCNWRRSAWPISAGKLPGDYDSHILRAVRPTATDTSPLAKPGKAVY